MGLIKRLLMVTILFGFQTASALSFKGDVSNGAEDCPLRAALARKDNGEKQREMVAALVSGKKTAAVARPARAAKSIENR